MFMLLVGSDLDIFISIIHWVCASMPSPSVVQTFLVCSSLTPSGFILEPPLSPGSNGVWSARGFFHPSLSAASRASMWALLWSIPA